MTTGGANPAVDQSHVIVAIPAQDEDVWKVSSEKIPHLTMLFLGDHLENVDRVAEFVKHAADTTLVPFMLEVDHRGLLGDKDADVLFFAENRPLKMLRDLRSYLLGDNDIRKAYDSADQFPSWTPHLTLGYPTAPANNPGNATATDLQRGWMRFDRIALWSGDFEGVEFPLKYPAESEFVHFGVKGMHWGQRKSDVAGVSVKTSHDAAKDAHEFARAKAFFGEGAGTRRKLIKQTVEGKSKRDPNYKKAFDHHLANQDMSKHVDKARSERTRKNVKNTTFKTARGVSHVLRGNSQYASAAAAMLVGGAMYAHKKGIDKMILNAGKKAYKDISGKGKIRAGMSASEFLKTMGVS